MRKNGTPYQLMIDYVTEEIRKREKSGCRSGVINLSPCLERPWSEHREEALHFRISDRTEGIPDLLYLDISWRGIMLGRKTMVFLDNAEKVEEQVAFTLGYGHHFSKSDFSSDMTKSKAKILQRLLADNGVEAGRTSTVAQAIGYLFDQEWEDLINWDC